ncbi:hypothetical protein FTUN_8747 [Frigoriglobus tundricola]|uniref:Uncharacterized protein n=1 Tax=Frigoriglobus tundricola TaxID=2774151 RepID=A0A6M5Z3Z0_9BACT|nr:hypothetical protein FTUN_8747 [Frigoriglobus tundricola]
MTAPIPAGSASHWYRTPDGGPRDCRVGFVLSPAGVRAFTREAAFGLVLSPAGGAPEFVLSPARGWCNPAGRHAIPGGKENVFKENDLKHCIESV